MQEEKSKLKAFTSAVTAAAQERAAKINAETEQLEREAMEDCADDVFAEVRRRVLELPEQPEYGNTLKEQLWRALDAVPGARSARVLLRREDMRFAQSLNAASPGVRLSFEEGGFSLGGLVFECAEKGRKIDLSFDAALEDLEGRFSEITGFSLEGADGQ